MSVARDMCYNVSFKICMEAFWYFNSRFIYFFFGILITLIEYFITLNFEKFRRVQLKFEEEEEEKNHSALKRFFPV